MATNNKAELKITISDETKKAARATKDLYNRIDSQGGFNSGKGSKAKSQIGGSLQTIEKYRNQQAIPKADFEGFSKALRLVSKVLVDYAASITKLSDEATKLKDQLQTYSESYDKTFGKLSTAQTKQNTAIGDLKDKFANTKIYKLKKDNTLYKNPISLNKALELYHQDPDKFRKNTVFKTGNKTETLESSDKKQYFDAYIKATNQVEKLTASLKKLDSQIAATQTAYKAQRAKDQASGVSTGGNAQLVAETQQNAIDVNRTTSNDISAAQTEQNNQAITNLSASINKQQSVLRKAAKAFTVYSTIVRIAKSALREAAATITELDKSLTEQARVTGRTRDQAYSLLTTYQNMAQVVGATTKEVAEASSEFIKQGKSIQDALTLSKAAVSAAKVAGISVGDSINYLTTALNGFKLSAEEARNVSDKFAAVASASASGYNEIAIALSKVASQANLAGRSIDYTTALLTTGLEVTREAPETMGTALKTIVARRREISDYGKTLEDDVDLNNVQTQLSYIGIQLTNQQGELRSTQDVLDELGKKWSTLNSNQQAAVAKALAGTRQQSRLIAMMDNYERVEELQQISERSAGATAAQLTKYREGLEASRNNLKVAWEKIVESFANSDFFIGLINSATTLLDIFNKLTQNEFVKGAVFAAVGIALANVIAKKKITNDLAREELELETQQRIDSIKAQQKVIEDQKKAAIDREIAIKKQAQDEAQAALDRLKAQKDSLEANKAEEISANNTLEKEKEISAEKKYQAQLATEAAKMSNAIWQIENGSAAEVEEGRRIYKGHTSRASKITRDYNQNIASLHTTHDSNEAEINSKYAKSESQITEAIAEQTKVVEKATETADEAAKNREKNINDALAQDKEYKASQDALQLLQAKGNSLLKGSLVLYSLRTTITSYWNKTQKLSIAIKKKLAAATAKDAAATTADTVAKGANTVATNKLKLAVDKLNAAWKANPAAFVVAGLVALGALIVGITIAIKKNLPSIANVSKAVGKLTNEIYELNKSNTAIDNAISKWDEYDNKLIKTEEDAKSLHDTLNQVSDSLTENQQKIYKQAQTDEERRRLLRQFKEDNNRQIKEDWTKVNQQIGRLSAADRKKVLSSDTSNLSDEDAENARVLQNATYARGNYQLYQIIDKNVNQLGKAKDAVESLGQAIISNLSAERVYELSQDNGKGIQQLVDNLSKVNTQVKQLASKDGSLKDRVAAYQEISAALASDSEQLAIFQKKYSEYSVFSQMSDDLLDLIDNRHISDQTLNQLYSAYEDLTDEDGNQLISAEDYHARFSSRLETFNDTQDVVATINATFGDIRDKIGDENWDKFVNIFDKLAESSLTISQNIDSFDNKVSGFYEKAAKWSTRSESDRAQFINENAGRFQGEEGKKLIQAFHTGDYDTIEKALSSNSNLEELRKQRLQEVNTALAVEKARKKDRNEALIEQLELEKKHLEDVNSLYAVSLKTRLEQEKNQLSEYKAYLQDEENAIKDSLTKRKEAYNKYFAAVNQAASDEEYKKTANIYRANLTKLGSSTDASAISQRADLEDKLQSLENQHLEDLRKRAQEAIISNIDTEISEISAKFDDLLNNNKQRLELRQNSMNTDNGDFFSKLISNELYKGATADEAQQYLRTLQSTFSNRLGNVDLSDIKISQEGQALVLNVNGQTYNLDTSSQQSLYQTIMSALRQLGVK